MTASKLKLPVALSLVLAVALPSGAPLAIASGRDGQAAAKKCKKGYVRKKAGARTKCVKKVTTPSGTATFDGKTAAGGFLRFVISGGRLANLSALAPRKCTRYSDNSVIQDIPNFRYSVGGTRTPTQSFKVAADGSVSGTFTSGSLGVGSSGVKLTLNARPKGRTLTGSFKVLLSYPTNGCDSGDVRF